MNKRKKIINVRVEMESKNTENGKTKEITEPKVGFLKITQLTNCSLD